MREKHGLAHKLCVKCNYCGFSPSQHYSSPRISGQTKSEWPAFEINRKSVDAFSSLGIGHRGKEKFCATVGMSGMDSKTFTTHMSALSLESETLKENSLQQAREIVKNAYKTVHAELSNDAVIDITVSYDGTWHKRGHTFAYGVGAVIDILTGLVVDNEIMSKHCTMCMISANELGAESPEFHAWYEGHKISECNKNYDGSSTAMEMCAADLMWKRSIENCQMRYTTILSDGETKTFNH